ncbi:MAG: hypothetical protein O3A51_04600 [Verrucomicrobia bacterium]|nr:hypothetical protein [Verrucomicrobiota bacterium]
MSGRYDDDSAVGGDLDLSAGLGHFIADDLEVGVLGAFSDNDAFTGYAVGVFGELNLPVDGVGVIPFVGVSATYADVDPSGGTSLDAVVGTASAGVKHFLSEDLAVAAQVEYSMASEDIYSEKNKIALSDTDLEVVLGLRYFWDK